LLEYMTAWPGRLIAPSILGGVGRACFDRHRGESETIWVEAV